MRNRELQLLLVGIIFILSCGNSESSGFTEGRVLTQSGVPVSNAELHIGFPQFSKKSKYNTSITINFPLQSSTNLSFEVKRYGSDEFILGFEDRPFRAGSHSLVIPDSLLTTGVYTYKIESEVFSTERNILKLKSDNDLINNSTPFTMTDNSGRFQLDTNTFGIGVKFAETIDIDETVSFSIDNEIEFITIKNSEIIARKTVMISENSENYVELIVQD